MKYLQLSESVFAKRAPVLPNIEPIAESLIQKIEGYTLCRCTDLNPPNPLNLPSLSEAGQVVAC